MAGRLDVDSFWQKIEDWDSTRPLASHSLLGDPASDDQISNLQSILKFKIPSNLIALLKRHNGAGRGWYCFSEGNFLSTSEIASEYSERLDNRKLVFGDQPVSHISSIGPVQTDIWREGWIPFLKRNKEPVCIDVDPPPEGKMGQVIEVDAEGCIVRVLAPTLEDFLHDVLDEI